MTGSSNKTTGAMKIWREPHFFKREPDKIEGKIKTTDGNQIDLNGRFANIIKKVFVSLNWLLF